MARKGGEKGYRSTTLLGPFTFIRSWRSSVHSSKANYNGREVGYNQGAFEPSEYDITDFISAGENLVAVKVFQWSDGIYLEDQD